MAGGFRPATEKHWPDDRADPVRGAVPHQRAGRLHDVPLPVPEGWRSVRTSTRRALAPTRNPEASKKLTEYLRPQDPEPEGLKMALVQGI